MRHVSEQIPSYKFPKLIPSWSKLFSANGYTISHLAYSLLFLSCKLVYKTGVCDFCGLETWKIPWPLTLGRDPAHAAKTVFLTMDGTRQSPPERKQPPRNQPSCIWIRLWYVNRWQYSSGAPSSYLHIPPHTSTRPPPDLHQTSAKAGVSKCIYIGMEVMEV